MNAPKPPQPPKEPEDKNRPKQSKANLEGMTTRREWIAGALAGAAALAFSKKSAASEKNPPYPFRSDYNDAQRRFVDPELQAMLDEDGNTISEKPTYKELTLMDSALQTLFAHWVDDSFWRAMEMEQREKEVKETFELLMKSENWDKFHYFKKGRLTWVVKRPHSKDKTIPDNFKIAVGDDGRLFEINGKKIDIPYNSNEDWKEMEKAISTITEKIIRRNRKVAVDPALSAEDQEKVKAILLAKWLWDNTTKAERAWFTRYNMELPRRILELMKKKPNQTTEEETFISDLEDMLREYPKTFSEMVSNMINQKPELPFFVCHWDADAPRPKPPKPGETVIPNPLQDRKKTPDGIVEFRYGMDPTLRNKGLKRFAGFSREGFLVIYDEKTKKWVRSDTRKTPFMDKYIKEHS